MARQKEPKRELIRLPFYEWSLRDDKGKEICRFKVGDNVKLETSFHKGIVSHTSIEAIKFMEDDVIFIEDLFQKFIPIDKILKMSICLTVYAVPNFSFTIFVRSSSYVPFTFSLMNACTSSG